MHERLIVFSSDWCVLMPDHITTLTAIMQQALKWIYSYQKYFKSYATRNLNLAKWGGGFKLFTIQPYANWFSALIEPGKELRENNVVLQINPTRCTILLCIFISLLYMFRATMCPSSGEIAVSMRHWYLSLCMGGVWSAGWSETPTSSL